MKIAPIMAAVSKTEASKNGTTYPFSSTSAAPKSRVEATYSGIDSGECAPKIGMATPSSRIRNSASEADKAWQQSNVTLFDAGDAARQHDGKGNQNGDGADVNQDLHRRQKGALSKTKYPATPKRLTISQIVP